MSLSLDSRVTFSGFVCLVPLSSEEGGMHGWGYQWMERSSGGGNWEDVEQFVPLSLSSGTLRCLFFLGSLQWEPPGRLGSAVCGGGAQGMQLLAALPGPDRLFPTELREENGISALLFHGKCF